MIDREVWDSWRVNWPAVSVGALAALMGTSLGAYQETHIESWRQFQVLALIVSIFGSFFSYAIGGWTTGRILAATRAERATPPAVIGWLVTIRGALGAMTALLVGRAAESHPVPLGRRPLVLLPRASFPNNLKKVRIPQ
jgi:hypothetical protein